MTLIVVLSQIWGDKKFAKNLIPYGGFVLALTWGLVHILTKDFTTGIYVAVVAFIVGVGFKLCNKNLLLTYLLALFIFIF
ncbi:hypothetical protein PV797_19830 [Clostridiaceae bacterium M8S5]|nr:hypothetical protein PV797_19830 [Clostridiaceae bacterium M8S5]